jgi:hypothetical protein
MSLNLFLFIKRYFPGSGAGGLSGGPAMPQAYANEHLTTSIVIAASDVQVFTFL